MQNRTQIFAACALPVMLVLGALAGCEAPTPGSTGSQIAIRQLDKATSKVTNKSNNNVGKDVAPVVNKPGTGSVTVRIEGMPAAARKVLYTRTDIQALTLFLDNDGAGPDAQSTFTQAQILNNTPNMTINNVEAGTYTAFVNAFDGPDPQTANSIALGGTAVTQNNVVVTAGNTTNLAIGLTLADTPATVGTVAAVITITDGN